MLCCLLSKNMLQRENEIMTTNMLNLPSFIIIDMVESEFDYRFLVESILPSPPITQNVVLLQTYISTVKRSSYFSIYQCTVNESGVI